MKSIIDKERGGGIQCSPSVWYRGLTSFGFTPAPKYTWGAISECTTAFRESTYANQECRNGFPNEWKLVSSGHYSNLASASIENGVLLCTWNWILVSFVCCRYVAARLAEIAGRPQFDRFQSAQLTVSIRHARTFTIALHDKLFFWQALRMIKKNI